MRILLPLCLFLAVAMITPQSSRANDVSIVPYMGQVPVLPPYAVDNDGIMVFDKPQGQIVEVPLICDANCPDLKTTYDYYRKTLSNLGWTPDDTMGFHKDQQSLMIEHQKLSKDNDTTLLIFRLITQ